MTNEEDREIAALYLSGENGYSIGRRFGVSSTAIYKALKRQGVSRRVGHPPTNWEDTENNRRQLIKAYEAGAGIACLARQFRINGRRVTQVLNEAGVEWRHPGGVRRFSDEEAAEFARLYQTGKGLTLIGRRYGVSAKVVRDYLVRSGIQLRPVGMSGFWTEERKAEAVRRYQAGEQLKDIAAAMGCDTKPLTRTLVELGVHEKKQWKRHGEDHHAWRGGRIIDGSGYVRVKVGDAEQHLADGNNYGYMMEHRLVMARLLGRRLLKHETVHHIDGNRQHNEPGNLQLRNGRHGKGTVFRCASCGSHDIEAVPLA